MSIYRPVNPRVSFPDLETALITSWKDRRVFERSLEQREGSPEWVFFEGPPTANAKPGIHHAESRVFKDIFCRFQTMRGNYVHRKGGWDCHGLPVEIEIEKQLGITQKRDIEGKVGIEEFTRLCRESVRRYVDDWEAFTDRIAFWLDLDDAYWTMTPAYVESVWWVLKQIWDKGLLEEDFKVVPYCPRCETSLSAHEQHQPGAYQDVEDPSVYVRFPILEPGWEDVSLLVWTTTPWTLLANIAAAAGPGVTYCIVEDPGCTPTRPGRKLVLARERVAALLGEHTSIERELPGSELIGSRYQPPFSFVTDPGPAGHTVRAGDFVTTEDGSGLVHLAPYGEEDMSVARRDGIEWKQMIDPSGRVAPDGGPFAGLWIKDADPKIVDDLGARGLLFRAERYVHAYPHCWRCRTPLLYYPRKDWYIRTSQIRDELQASNEETNWQPPTIKRGRFGDWLANNVDWSLSRDRYWGTPLPVWRCEQGHATCVGSFAELGELSGHGMEDFDPHRPAVDEITIRCPQCGEGAQRVTAVIDAWFDSGAMPFAQWHYPFENQDLFEKRFPADFISEAIDQTRGWFYSLLAISTLIRGHNSFRNVVCLGHIVDGEGRKMSKSIGNVLDPWTVLDAQGADALRWYLLAGGTPWSARRLSPEIIEEVLRKHLLTLWNTYSFWVTYATLEDLDPSTLDIPVGRRPEMDRWIMAELDDTVRTVTAALDTFDATGGGRRIERFVDDLSNWYVRRGRRRFWRSTGEEDTDSAFLTLWECLTTVAQLAAPYTPFIADEIYSNLMAPVEGAPDSVHLSDWPVPEDERVDDRLRTRMQLARRLVGLGRSARTEAKIRIRQPLRRALVVIPAADAADIAGLEGIIGEELNVKSIETAVGIGELVTYSVKPNFKVLGPRFGARMPVVAAAVAAADAHGIVGSLEAEGVAIVDVEGEPVTFSREDLDVRVEGRPGFSLAQDGPYGVALDVELTPELVIEGNARELIRSIQDLRKSSGLAVEDRIELWLYPSPSHPPAELVDPLKTMEAFIAAEVLATTINWSGDIASDASTGEVELEGGKLEIALRRA